MINLPETVKLIINMLEKNGHSCYIVGGCVRDSLREKTPKDWDLTTSAAPDETLKVFEEYNTFKAGKRFGTVGVQIDGEVFEITTFRKDGIYEDCRRPNEVSFTKDIHEDLSRRDFTVNAMAYSEKESLIDIFDGQSDLKAGILRCVGDPNARLTEDALRIMRALRFASEHGFIIEKATQESMFENMQLLNSIAVERISAELMRIICGQNAENILTEYRDIFAVFIPELKVMFDYNQNTPYHNRDLWGHTVFAVADIETEPVLRLAMLLHDIGKPETRSIDTKGVSHYYGHQEKSVQMAEKILHKLKLPKMFISDILTLISYHDVRFNGNERHIKRVLRKIGVYQFRKLLQIQEADMNAQSEHKSEEKRKNLRATKEAFEEIIEKEHCFNVCDLAINGNDIIKAMEMSPGKRVGEILDALLEAVISNKVKNEKEALLNFVKLTFI